jgi:hypothetical protein
MNLTFTPFANQVAGHADTIFSLPDGKVLKKSVAKESTNLIT